MDGHGDIATVGRHDALDVEDEAVLHIARNWLERCAGITDNWDDIRDVRNLLGDGDERTLSVHQGQARSGENDIALVGLGRLDEKIDLNVVHVAETSGCSRSAAQQDALADARDSAAGDALGDATRVLGEPNWIPALTVADRSARRTVDIGDVRSIGRRNAEWRSIGVADRVGRTTNWAEDDRVLGLTLGRAVLDEEIAEVEVGIDRTRLLEHAVVGVEVEVEVNADLLEPVAGHGDDASLVVDLQRADCAELSQQTLDVAMITTSVGDDQVAVELLNATGVATSVAPTIGIDLLLNDVGDLLDELLARLALGIFAGVADQSTAAAGTATRTAATTAEATTTAATATAEASATTA